MAGLAYTPSRLCAMPGHPEPPTRPELDLFLFVRQGIQVKLSSPAQAHNHLGIEYWRLARKIKRQLQLSRQSIIQCDTRAPCKAGSFPLSPVCFP